MMCLGVWQLTGEILNASKIAPESLCCWKSFSFQDLLSLVIRIFKEDNLCNKCLRTVLLCATVVPHLRWCHICITFLQTLQHNFCKKRKRKGNRTFTRLFFPPWRLMRLQGGGARYVLGPITHVASVHPSNNCTSAVVAVNINVWVWICNLIVNEAVCREVDCASLQSVWKEILSNESTLKLILYFNWLLWMAKAYSKALAMLMILLKTFVMG